MPEIHLMTKDVVRRRKSKLNGQFGNAVVDFLYFQRLIIYFLSN
ncbi:hypothetical protein Q7O_000703 [Pectobacterium carotovorum subsp. carotovorum PCCS1]|nr:hypothetical protein [Pectobacterium carotovorum subsp. carotovorum PCCS1]